jgi:8-oxo-dGTP diphosphatase/2-hydroxy-dATP diphosphatase
MENKKKKRILTLCLVQRDGQLLLGLKKRGFGIGRWNGFGGKVEAGETVEEAAARELFEESGLRAEEMEKVGEIDFDFQDSGETLRVHVFRCRHFSGLPVESEEMKPEWFAENNPPLGKMWSDDQYWLHLLVAGKKFKAHFIFDGEKSNHIVERSVVEVDKL